MGKIKSAAISISFLIVVLAAATAYPASAQALSSFPFTLQGSSITACWYYGVSLAVTAGQHLTVQWSENPEIVGPTSLNFYIAPLASIQRVWLCDTGPVFTYWNDGAYGTTNWTAPSTGEYVAILVNYSYYSVSGTISLNIANSTLSASPIGPAAVRRQICVAPSCAGS